MDFAFQREEDGSLSPRAAILQALGAASMCWDHPEAAGVFHPVLAIKIADALIDELGVTDDPASTESDATAPG